MRNTLSQLKAQNRLPAIVGVNGSNSHIMRNTSTGDTLMNAFFSLLRPIKTLHDYIDTKLGIANHVVTIYRYDPASDRVYVRNSWGKDNDDWLSVSELWNSM